ncbi:MAG: hypothetical protein MJZ71_09085 [Bacteroidales bacterium]|nr:hypothetical protein [Bacteroidales bacterium]
MAKYIAKIKEIGNLHILTSSLEGIKKTKEELISFWGLDNDDVEWYELFELIDGKEVKL